jgi:hypothetical protein
MYLRPRFYDYEKSAFAEMSLPLEVLHPYINLETSPYPSEGF